MSIRAILIALSAVVLAIGAAAPASAAGVDTSVAITDDDDVAGRHRDRHDAGPDDTSRPGPPEDPGKPENPGQAELTNSSARTMPELPANASPRAYAAVTAAYEQHELIKAQIAAIRGLAPGPDRDAAIDELMAEFAGLVYSVSDAVHEADPHGDGSDGDTEGGEIETLEAALLDDPDADDPEGDDSEGDGDHEDGDDEDDD